MSDEDTARRHADEGVSGADPDGPAGVEAPGDPYVGVPWSGPGPAGAEPLPPYGARPGVAAAGWVGPTAGHPARSRNGMGNAALVCGIAAALLSVIVIGIVPGVLAVVFGILGRGRVRRGEATNQRSATAGIYLGVFGIAVAVAVGLAFGLRYGPQLSQYVRCESHASTSSARATCRSQFRQQTGY